MKVPSANNVGNPLAFIEYQSDLTLSDRLENTGRSIVGIVGPYTPQLASAYFPIDAANQGNFQVATAFCHGIGRRWNAGGLARIVLMTHGFKLLHQFAGRVPMLGFALGAFMAFQVAGIFSSVGVTGYNYYANNGSAEAFGDSLAEIFCMIAEGAVGGMWGKRAKISRPEQTLREAAAEPVLHLASIVGGGFAVMGAVAAKGRRGGAGIDVAEPKLGTPRVKDFLMEHARAIVQEKKKLVDIERQVLGVLGKEFDAGRQGSFLYDVARERTPLLVERAFNWSEDSGRIIAGVHLSGRIVQAPEGGRRLLVAMSRMKQENGGTAYKSEFQVVGVIRRDGQVMLSGNDVVCNMLKITDQRFELFQLDRSDGGSGSVEYLLSSDFPARFPLRHPDRYARRLVVFVRPTFFRRWGEHLEVAQRAFKLAEQEGSSPFPGAYNDFVLLSRRAKIYRFRDEMRIFDGESGGKIVEIDLATVNPLGGIGPPRSAVHPTPPTRLVVRYQFTKDSISGDPDKYIGHTLLECCGDYEVPGLVVIRRPSVGISGGPRGIGGGWRT